MARGLGAPRSNGRGDVYGTGSDRNILRDGGRADDVLADVDESQFGIAAHTGNIPPELT